MKKLITALVIGFVIIGGACGNSDDATGGKGTGDKEVFREIASSCPGVGTAKELAKNIANDYVDFQPDLDGRGAIITSRWTHSLTFKDGTVAFVRWPVSFPRDVQCPRSAEG